tara:strand:+ start:593 stop:1240 length:648 start_codon:yes stop_codon:yes gene_type:complete
MQDKNIQQNQQDKPSNDIVIVPFIEENIPIPKNAREALPSMNSEDEVMLRAQTIKEVSDIMGEEIVPNAKNIKDAEDIARKMVENPGMKQEYGLYANETVAYLGGLVGTYNHLIVKDLADLKLFVVNKLVEIVHHEDSNIKEQITALRSIGEVDGIDAFKKKTEVIHKMETMEEVEVELLSMLKELKAKALLKPKQDIIDAEIVEDVRDETEDNE